MSKTPIKRKLSYPGDGSPFSKFNTPKQKGQSIDKDGYLVYVGQLATSMNGNSYFDIKIQCNENDTDNLRVMQMPEARQDMMTNLNNRIKFTNVFKDGVLFVNGQQGSRYSYINDDLPFPPLDNVTKCTSIKDVLSANKEKVITLKTYDIHAQLKWVTEEKRTEKKGNPYRNCVLFDGETSALCTIWRESMLEIPEQEWHIFSSMSVEDYFGMKFQTNGSYHL